MTDTQAERQCAAVGGSLRDVLPPNMVGQTRGRSAERGNLQRIAELACGMLRECLRSNAGWTAAPKRCRVCRYNKCSFPDL